ncbi:hypothetical protein FHS54_000104 [Sphingobium vermicomposti]|uniref:Nucleotidyltransferase family protein n=1 Tax=Sphingobium vermicomposti TaxID=529005 RepID=A0A846MBI7_9SPHN|nr:hypothetical protein [Sphingobium vermicomposti]
MTPYRPEFTAALEIFARICAAMVERGFTRPILVGGAAVEFYSMGFITTGDFDLCSPAQDTLEAEFQRHGFVRPSGPGRATRGWVHPDLGLGFEVVGDMPLDGSVTREHIALVEDFDDSPPFAIISVEDLIADRMGQYASGTAREMLAQAQTLLRLHPDANMDYLEQRVRHETGGDFGAEDVLDRQD